MRSPGCIERWLGWENPKIETRLLGFPINQNNIESSQVCKALLRSRKGLRCPAHLTREGNDPEIVTIAVALMKHG